MPNTMHKKRLRVRKNADSPWIDIPAIVSTPGGIDPVDKTSAMTQPVGRDADGKLWTAPGDGGGGGSVSVDYDPETGDFSITTTGGGGSVSVDYDPETGELIIGGTENA